MIKEFIKAVALEREYNKGVEVPNIQKVKKHIDDFINNFYLQTSSEFKIVFIAHPVGGDIQGNIEKIKAIHRNVSIHEKGVIPFTPYMADILSLDDKDRTERMIGLINSQTILSSGIVDELRLYGDKISPGMKEEVIIAMQLGIPIVAMTEETKKSLNKMLL